MTNRRDRVRSQTWRLLLTAFVSASAIPSSSALPQTTSPMTPDVPAYWRTPSIAKDYEARRVMVPMRDGTKLFTLILIPRGAKDAPILLTRTPYDASARLDLGPAHLADALPLLDRPFVADGYIRVFQDVRGRQRSEGDYVVTRPPRGPLNQTGIDHSTDAYDTIDWLVRNVPESNGRVGMIGSSYEGFTVASALLDPHPALKAAVPENPMIDGWTGDDWFHHGAFRQINLGFFSSFLSSKTGGADMPRAGMDDYENFLAAGSVGNMARIGGIDQTPYWRKITENPAYGPYWQAQALDRLLAKVPLRVPTLWVAGLWDQEDIWGAVHAYAAVEPKDVRNDMNFIVLGPWRHSGVNYQASGIGPLSFDEDTATTFRTRYLKPFLDARLKTGAPPDRMPPVLAFESGTNLWRSMVAWPTACASGCAKGLRPVYLRADRSLSDDKPQDRDASDLYVSDPSNPVPYVSRPVRRDMPEQWRGWLAADQRFVDGRPDVLSYASPRLSAPMKLSGAPGVDLFASTSGSDADFVVKLIDVFPDEVAGHPELSGYQLMIAADIFRARYREDPAKAVPMRRGKVERVMFPLPQVNHVLLQGHRLMVQIQSSWFPLYDRNPQSFVPNVFFAPASSYRRSDIRVFRSKAFATRIDLPVVDD